MSATVVAAVMRKLLVENNLPLGTSLENRVTWMVHRTGLFDQFQYQVGPYQLDYAWPSPLVALEVQPPTGPC